MSRFAKGIHMTSEFDSPDNSQGLWTYQNVLKIANGEEGWEKIYNEMFKYLWINGNLANIAERAYYNSLNRTQRKEPDQEEKEDFLRDFRREAYIQLHERIKIIFSNFDPNSDENGYEKEEERIIAYVMGCFKPDDEKKYNLYYQCLRELKKERDFNSVIKRPRPRKGNQKQEVKNSEQDADKKKQTVICSIVSSDDSNEVSNNKYGIREDQLEDKKAFPVDESALQNRCEECDSMMHYFYRILGGMKTPEVTFYYDTTYLSDDFYDYAALQFYTRLIEKDKRTKDIYDRVTRRVSDALGISPEDAEAKIREYHENARSEIVQKIEAIEQEIGAIDKKIEAIDKDSKAIDKESKKMKKFAKIHSLHEEEDKYWKKLALEPVPRKKIAELLEADKADEEKLKRSIDRINHWISRIDIDEIVDINGADKYTTALHLIILKTMLEEYGNGISIVDVVGELTSEIGN